MANYQWILKSESETERIYEIKTSTSEDGKDCSPAANKLLNDRWEILKKNLTVGFYHFKEIHQQKKYNSDANEDVARFSYKEKLDKKFVDMGLSVRIQPLFNPVSDCLSFDKYEFKKNPKGLRGAFIHVQTFELVDTIYNGKPTKANRVIWYFLDDEPITENQVQEDHTEPIVENPVQVEYNESEVEMSLMMKEYLKDTVPISLEDLEKFDHLEWDGE